MATFLYVVVLAGSLLIFAPELDYGQHRRAPTVGPVSPALAQQALGALPGTPADWRQVILRYPSPQSPYLMLSARPVQGEAQLFVADASGAVRQLPRNWSDFLRVVHERLVLPGASGEILVGLLGMALLTMLLGGVLSYPRAFRDAFLFRGRASERLRQADLHHRLGSWALPFHLAIGFSGAFMALALPLVAVVGQFGYHSQPSAVAAALLGPFPGASRAPAATPPDLMSILEQVDQGDPAAIQRIVVTNPGTAGRLVRVDIDKPHRLVYGDQTFFDARGKPLTPGGVLAERPGLAFYSGLVAVHFGSYGGTLLRVAYGLLGLALCTIVASGVRHWFAIQRSRERPRARTERLWIGWMWGIPLAFAASYAGALASTVLAAAPGIVFTCVLALALLLSMPVRKPVRLSQLLRSLFAATVLLDVLLVWI